jgi:TatD DNase family protein
MEFIDTHCHLQFDKYSSVDEVVERAKTAAVKRLICVGTSLADSQKAIKLSRHFENVWATAGVHPHEADDFLRNSEATVEFKELLNMLSIIAVGEIGLDYYKDYSTRQNQAKVLRAQIELALDKELPFIFHVRDAWKDFWPIFDDYKSAGQQMRGVIHSFTGGTKQLDQALDRGLLVALNGIVTYTRDQALLEAAKQVPIDKLVLETDAPFLTPAPYRSEICEPKHTRITAEFLAELRNESIQELASATTANAVQLFSLESASE